MSPTIYLVLRPLTDSENRAVEGMAPNSVEIYTTAASYVNIDASLGHRLHQIEPPRELQQQTRNQFFDRVLGFRAQKWGGKSVLEALNYEQVNYWYYLRFTCFYRPQPFLFEHAAVNYFMRDREGAVPTFVYSVHDFSSLFPDVTFAVPASPKNITDKILFLLKFALVFQWRALSGWVNHFRLGKGKHVVLHEMGNKNILLDNETLQPKKGDYYNDYLIQAVSRHPHFSVLSEFYPPGHARFSLSDVISDAYSRKGHHLESYIWLALLNPALWVRGFRFYRHLQKWFAQAPAFAHVYDAQIFKMLVSGKALLVYMYVRQEAAGIFMAAKRVKSVSGHHEHSYHHKSTMEAGKKAGVPTFGIQHGTIHRQHMHYVFDAVDAAYAPYPKYMLVWGEYWKKMLTRESAYETDNVFVVGQLRTDIIPKLKNKSAVRSKPNIVYASQPDQIGKQIHDMLLRDFFRLCQTYSADFNFIIKPHPGEKTDENFERNAREVGGCEYTISRGELYSLLSETDILLVYHSTVGTEGVYFRIPVFMFDYFGNDFSDYSHFEGAFFKAKNIDDFHRLIRQYKEGALPVDKAVQDAFIEKYAYRIDGQTCHRHMEIIEKLSAR